MKVWHDVMYYDSNQDVYSHTGGLAVGNSRRSSRVLVTRSNNES